jgi:hypothetical protein
VTTVSAQTIAGGKCCRCQLEIGGRPSRDVEQEPADQAVRAGTTVISDTSQPAAANASPMRPSGDE